MKISLNWLKEYLEGEFSLPLLINGLNTIGLMVESWEEKGDDVILDIETYANRPDTLGHLGIARELTPVLGLSLKKKSWPLTEADVKTSSLVDVQIWDEDLCPRYCGLVVKDIKVGPSSEWLRKRIEAMGLNSINNVVDVTNYVLFSTAQPIHAFDLAKIGGGKVIVRRAKKGEMLKSLDSIELSLSPDMLVIADDEKPMALAGIIGGEGSAVTDETRDVFIESAYFDPVSVRKTRKALGIETDASYRFERGADISFPPAGALMTASLLTQLGGKATREITDVFPSPKKTKEVILRYRRVGELLGEEVGEDFIQDFLHRLGFTLEAQRRGIWKVKVPSFRVDIEREVDLIEEIARFYGYDKIPSVVPPVKVTEPTPDKSREMLDKLRHALFHQGFDEVLNFSFSDPEKERGFASGRTPVEIRNPISAKASLLRTTLLGGLLETTAWNVNRGMDGIHIFEVGNVFSREKEEFRERLMLGFSTTGPVGEPHWQKEAEAADFFHLKGTCEFLMAYLRYDPFSFEEKDFPLFEEGYSLSLVYKGETVGYLGLVRRSILQFYSLKQDVYAAELDFDLLMEKQRRPFQYVPVVKYPGISRDISFVVSRKTAFKEIKEAVEKLSLPFLEGFTLIDRFEGPSIAKDKVSLSLRFVFRSPKRTLRADEVDKIEQKVLGHLKTVFGIQLREGGKIDK